MTYTLKIYDTELMTFELTQKPLEGFCCQIISVNEKRKPLLPLGMTVAGDGVLSWLKSRGTSSFSCGKIPLSGHKKNLLLPAYDSIFLPIFNPFHWVIPPKKTP